MKKLTLDIDALAVESFDADAARGERGTVEAHQIRTPLCSAIDACPTRATCDIRFCA